MVYRLNDLSTIPCRLSKNKNKVAFVVVIHVAFVVKTDDVLAISLPTVKLRTDSVCPGDNHIGTSTTKKAKLEKTFKISNSSVEELT